MRRPSRSSDTITLHSPQPNPPARQFSFTDFQTNNPSAPLPGDRIDGEYDRTNQALEDTLDWVSVSLNSDGTLKPQSVTAAHLQPGLFDHLAAAAIAQIRPLVDEARRLLTEAVDLAAAADASALAAAEQTRIAYRHAITAHGDAEDAAASAAEAAASALAAAASATSAAVSANDAEGDAALAQDWGVVAIEWAEHMPDTIPPNILAITALTGDHWSSRWWANQAHFPAMATPLLDYRTPAEGATVTLGPMFTGLYLSPAADLNVLNVILPPSPADGQTCEITSTKGIFTLTVTAPAGATVSGGSTMLSPNGGIAFRYRASNTSWCRRY